MDRAEVKERCQAVLARIFAEQSSRFEGTTTADDIPKWDSLSHMVMLTMLEKRLEVRIPAARGVEAKNFGELVDLIVALKQGDG